MPVPGVIIQRTTYIVNSDNIQYPPGPGLLKPAFNKFQSPLQPLSVPTQLPQP